MQPPKQLADPRTEVLTLAVQYSNYRKNWMPDKIFFEQSGVTLETPPEPAGPLELADLIKRLRHQELADESRSHLSDQGVSKLLELAFYLSMRADEGRFPRLRIISGERDDHRLAVKLTTPLKFDDVHEVRRIAPIAGSPAFAVLVTESQDGNLECPGLAHIRHLGLESKPDRPEILNAVGEPPSTLIWIEGPGHLFVQDGVTTFEFRAGRVRLVIPALTYVTRLRNFMLSVSTSLHQRALEIVDDIPGADKYFSGYRGLAGIVHVVLQRILDTCLELRHGGAFVILPESDGTPKSFDIDCKYTLDTPNLGDDIAKYWSAYIRASNSKEKGVDEYNKWLSKCFPSKARLLSNVEAVANMSAADGCVVLTEQLRLHGFGGNILVSEEECKNTDAEAKLSMHYPCDIDHFLSSVGGQRHQSAARLIIKHKNVIVFVISQDGELSVFATDSDGYVRVYRPVDPWYLTASMDHEKQRPLNQN